MLRLHILLRRLLLWREGVEGNHSADRLDSPVAAMLANVGLAIGAINGSDALDQRHGAAKGKPVVPARSDRKESRLEFVGDGNWIMYESVPVEGVLAEWLMDRMMYKTHDGRDDGR